MAYLGKRRAHHEPRTAVDHCRGRDQRRPVFVARQPRLARLRRSSGISFGEVGELRLPRRYLAYLANQWALSSW